MTLLREPERAPQAEPAVEGPPAGAQRHFLSWVRDGVAAHLDATDPGSGPLPARGTIDTGLSVNGVAVAGPGLAVHGPGDVTGIDPRQVVRTDPPDRATDFEPEHLAAIDFDDPALPWRYTPAAPHPDHGLRPWLVLVVVDVAEDDVRLDPPSGGPLPVLTVPRAKLPDLARSAAWAHAEVTVAGGEDVDDVLRTKPERSVSRLLSPRLLRAGHRYLACLVPAFAHGVAAGLGTDPDGDTTEPAWTGAAGTTRLPVYLSWSFATGADGDFPALAGRLRPVEPADGRRTLSYRDADPELTPALGNDPGVATLLPALHPATATPDDPPNAAWSAAMLDVLRRGDQELIPPIRLAAHVDHGPVWTDHELPWQSELNGDPRWRAVAGLGARFVQLNQEALMAAAWRQAADLAEANRQLEQATLGRAVSESLHRRHFDPQSPTGLTANETGAAVVVARGAGALGRIASTTHSLRADATASAGTVAQALDAHPATASVVSGSVQKLLRPTGPLAKTAGASAAAPMPGAVVPVATGAVVPDPGLVVADDAGVLDRVPDAGIQYRGITAELITAADPWWRAWAGTPPANRPTVTPGADGYLADFVVVDQATPGGPLTLTVHRELDVDARFRVPGTAFPLPNPPGAPAELTLLGASLLRGFDAEPALVMVLADKADMYAQRQHYLRVVKGITATGYREATGLTALGGPIESDRSVSVHTWALPTGLQLMLTWQNHIQSDTLDRWCFTFDQLGIPENLQLYLAPLADTGARSITAAPLPLRPADQPRTPTDTIVVWLVPEDPVIANTWLVRYMVVHDDPFHQFGPVLDGGTLGERAPDEADLLPPRLALSVTDVDGDGKLEVLVTATGPHVFGGVVGEWQLSPYIAGELDIGGSVAAAGGGSSGGWVLPATERTVPVVGDTTERRFQRVAGIGDRFQAAAAAHQAQLIVPATRSAPPPAGAPYSVAAVAQTVTSALDPAVTVPKRALDRITLAGTPLPAAGSSAAADGLDPLRPRWFEPSFDVPLAEQLRADLPELAFPGADAVPVDGVALMTGNAELIAAYLAGVNDEFGRWTGSHATWFRRYFDGRAATGGGDIADIADWGGRRLSEVVTGAGGADGCALVVRGSLVHRFPNVIVQAVRAGWSGGTHVPTDETLPPTFTGAISPDTALYGFPRTAAQLRGEADGDPGWFLCFAEAPTQSRFGHAEGQQWDRPGAHTAAALLALPYRVLIHASDLLEAHS